MKALDRSQAFTLNHVMRTYLRQLSGQAIVLGAIGLVAIGISGGVAAGMSATAGRSFVAGDPPGVHYSPDRCAEFFEYVPHAHTCEQAATEHHFGEVVEYRLAAGVIGLVMLGASVFAARRRFGFMNTDQLPRGLRDSLAASAFGVSGVALTAIAVDQMTRGRAGAGEALSAGLVAILGAAFFAARRFATSR